MRIEGGDLAGTFGSEAYLRIIPQANSTFTGEFNCDFSAEKPMTNLLALNRRMTAPILQSGGDGRALPRRRGLAGLAHRPIAWRGRCVDVPAPDGRPLRRWASPA